MSTLQYIELIIRMIDEVVGPALLMWICWMLRERRKQQS